MKNKKDCHTKRQAYLDSFIVHVHAEGDSFVESLLWVSGGVGVQVVLREKEKRTQEI
jgi:hypothetical protein